jgi:glycosyltransferase involved in cell wall biosynthesis
VKILLSAYSCEPGKGSEPGIGWNWAKTLGDFHEVWVLTRANNRGPIEKALEKEPMPNVRWIYCDLPGWMRFWKKGEKGVRRYYCLWQIAAYFVVRRLHQKEGFDVVHHVTFSNYWLPIFLNLLDVPLIWGPVGGGESAPKTFHKTFGFRGRCYQYSRDVARWMAMADPFVHLTARRARIGLATSSETAQKMRRLGTERVEVLSQVALSCEDLRRLSVLPVRDTNPFRLISLGRLLHWKGFHLGLAAFAQFQREFPESEYWIIGHGPERSRLDRLAKRMGVAGKVTFFGAVSRARALELLAECSVLLHPSLHDSGGWVCLEAMAAGRPVVCLDLGGPALQVTPETGIKVPALRPEPTIRDLADAMRRLARDPVLRTRMGEAARCRVSEHFVWDKKAEYLGPVYQEALKCTR